MTHILALDTSGNACSVALWNDAGLLMGKEEPTERQHTKRLLPMVKDLLLAADVKMSNLDAIAYGRGPGSFTGIRIAAGVAQGLAFGIDCKVLPISTLAALALRLHQQSNIANLAYACSLDARMGEVYWGEYIIDEDHPEIALPQVAERVCSPTQVEVVNSLYAACGSGMAVANIPQAIIASAQSVCSDLQPRALEMARLAGADFALGRQCAPEDALPVYLRDEVTWQKLPRYQ
ncbi:tRNA (adenosine(37)-N6)-threonylcarbamoyltransferase complex dimerization subunit type 1 TsaB [Candidatus Njordibacter sp. Uisw_039]|jgi:tRNA threonylcarbamoyladenosine biosynthesis protein TsaB|uniref:tRNA (adenosine(37)-N6)-threonylcarbamoyltransferase complex dimerization subunit type 1 TsaB n=1 Tax=Candidatus Njordibacter sp. Uisw_039 TaxID=3230972 RepID=UPI003A17F9A6|tara:strand:+ start:54984 stop:55685 length:702 start_codon:yes stop_codon:yes gene_type:complete